MATMSGTFISLFGFYLYLVTVMHPQAIWSHHT